MKLEKPDPRIGAIATEVDVRALSDADWKALYGAWLDGIVLVVRGQTLSMEEFLAYSRRFGRLKPHRVKKTRHVQYPELTVMGLGTRKPDGQVDPAIYNREIVAGVRQESHVAQPSAGVMLEAVQP